MKKISISTRILFVATFIVLLLIIGLTLISRSFLTEKHETEINKIVKSRKFDLQQDINELKQFSLYTANLYSEIDQLKDIYEKYYETGNLEEASKKLHSELHRLIEVEANSSNLYPEINYFLPSKEILASSTNDTHKLVQDDFLESMNKINKFQTAFSGIELDTNSLSIKGLAPIVGANSKYYGSVEVLFSFDEIFNKISLPENEYMAVYLSVKEFSSYKNDTLQQRVGNFIFNNSSSNLFNHEIVDREVIANALEKGVFSEDKNDYTETITPIYDINENIVALVVHQIHNKDYFDLRFNLSLVLLIVGILVIILLFGFLFYLNQIYIIKPIIFLTEIVRDIKQGKNIHFLNLGFEDEISDLNNELKNYIDYRKDVEAFVIAIDKDKSNTFNLEKLNKNDKLVKPLISMHERLEKAKLDEQKRQKDQQIRKWTSDSFTNFNRLIREYSDLDKLTDAVLKELIDVLKANQGGIFILSDSEEEPTFELVASYAYDRRRYYQKTILLGEGLIGMAALEKETVFLTELPDTYMELTSGLGSAVPKCLLIVPLLQDDNVLGVIELASFEGFEDYKISFVEEVAKSISSSISMTKINKKTQDLLEETKFQAEQMAAQEEEMRQNMEELTATQEEMSKKEAVQTKELENLNIQFQKKIEELKLKELEMQGVFNALNTSTFLIEYDLEGNIIFANDYVANLFGKTKKELIGRQQSAFVQYSDIQIQESRKMWDKLRKGEVIKSTHRLIINNREIWLSETYTPIFDETGNPHKVLKISHNISQEKSKERDLKETMQNIDKIKESQSRTIDKIVKRAERKEAKLRAEIKVLKEQLKSLNK